MDKMVICYELFDDILLSTRNLYFNDNFYLVSIKTLLCVPEIA